MRYFTTILLIFAAFLSPIVSIAQLAPDNDQYIQTNLLINPGFENGKSSWVTTGSASLVSSTTNLQKGNRSASLSPSGAWTLTQTVTKFATSKSGQEAELSISVQTTATDVWLCSGINGVFPTPSVANGCANYTGNNTPQKLTVFPLFGSTSTALRLSGPSATTVYIDDAYLGDRKPSSLGAKTVNWTNFGVFTADTTLFGQGTMSSLGGATPCKYSQNGFMLDVICDFQGGTVTGTLGAMLLPSGYTIDTSRIAKLNGTGADGVVVGRWSTNGANTLGNIVTATGTATDRVYMTGSFNNALMLRPQAPVSFVASNANWSINYSVPVVGGDTSAFTTRCDDPRNCETELTAIVYPATSIQSQNTGTAFPWITTCTNANPSVCTFTSGVFSATPSCTATPETTGARHVTVRAVSSTSVSIHQYLDNGTDAASNFSLNCSKQGADYANSRITQQIVQSRGVPTVPGASGAIDTFSVSYGTTNATTICSASPCSHLDQLGNIVSSITRASTGQYTANLSKSYTKIKCTGSGNPGLEATLRMPGGSTGSSIVFQSVNGAQTSVIDSAGTLMCQGSY